MEVSSLRFWKMGILIFRGFGGLEVWEFLGLGLRGSRGSEG